MAYSKRLRELNLISLAGVDCTIITVFSCLIGGCREYRADSFQRCTVTGQDASDKSCIAKAEIPIRPPEKDFHKEGSQTLEQVVQPGSAVYIPGDT